MAAPVPITIRGVRYASCTEAALKFGVSTALVNYYKKRGSLDKLGLKTPIHKGGAKTVTIHGVTYDSYREAAEAYGVTTAAISKAVRRGALDTIGERAVLS